ncbi:MAG: alpha amylase C-terminal domain-containing protein, partial [Deinococcus sp.]|nr:alpha amylase C-terminal domain-containing protein [Deinococcus sp.]
NHDESLEWHLLQYDSHRGLQQWVEHLNQLYRREPALHELDFSPAGFEWIDCNDADHSVISLIRKGRSPGEVVLIVCNFTPVPHHNYLVGAPQGGGWQEVLNSDAPQYGGSGYSTSQNLAAAPLPHHGRPHSLSLTLPPLAIVFLKREGRT